MQELFLKNLCHNHCSVWYNDYHGYYTCEHMPYFTPLMMIQTDGCGLLNHKQRIAWLKAFGVCFIDKGKKSSL